MQSQCCYFLMYLKLEYVVGIGDVSEHDGVLITPTDSLIEGHKVIVFFKLKNKYSTSKIFILMCLHGAYGSHMYRSPSYLRNYFDFFFQTVFLLPLFNKSVKYKLSLFHRFRKRNHWIKLENPLNKVLYFMGRSSRKHIFPHWELKKTGWKNQITNWHQKY